MNLLVNRYTIALAAMLLLALGGWAGFRYEMHEARAAGYAQRAAEDAEALATERTRLSEDEDRALEKSRAIIDELQNELADNQANLASARDRFAAIRVRPPQAASDRGTVPGTGSGPASADGAAAERRDMPSLAVIGAELSRCDEDADRFDALQQWVAARHPLVQ